MKKQELVERITKKEEQIKKIEKRIAKWTAGLRPQDIATVEVFGNVAYGTAEYTQAYNNYKAYKQANATEIPTSDDWNKGPNFEEAYAAYRDLSDARLTLKKYQNMIQVEEAKENELTNNRVDVIWNFLLQYKDRVKEFVRDNLKWVKEFHRLDKISCDLYNNGWSHTVIVNGKRQYEEEYGKRVEEVKRQRKEARENIADITSLVVKRDYSNYENNGSVIYTVDEEKLEEILTKDIEGRYFKLIDQITKYTGKILDATGLRIGAKGDLNGYVAGEEGKAKVETIGAGGYNIQCFHYRTLVNKMN